MHRTGRLSISFLGLVFVVGTLSCRHPTERFEGVCQLISKDVVTTDDKGEPLQMDLELEWDACPGDQYQVVRGGGDFAKCMAKYEVGDMVPVRVVHFWDSLGFYRWDLDRVGDCERSVEPESAGSYEKSQECNDAKSHGHVDGFTCSRLPFKKLVSVCPWMARD